MLRSSSTRAIVGMKPRSLLVRDGARACEMREVGPKCDLFATTMRFRCEFNPDQANSFESADIVNVVK
jgi:hypothetical protein